MMKTQIIGIFFFAAGATVSSACKTPHTNMPMIIIIMIMVVMMIMMMIMITR